MKKFILFTLVVILFYSCGKNYTPEQEQYIKKIKTEREAKNNEMKNSPYSPFKTRTQVEFHPLKYYNVDPEFVFEAKMNLYEIKDTINIQGTKGEARKTVRFGWFDLNIQNTPFKLNVYESAGRNGQKYYSIWFTDKTTNNETYGVGRYLHFQYIPDPDHIYTLDFNTAFNPYCAYSPDYSCAMPTKEDYIDVAIRAGEKKFHD